MLSRADLKAFDRTVKEEKAMKSTLIVAIVLMSFIFIPVISFADTVTANENLQRAINELEAAKVYVQQAKEQSPPNQRVVFHYDWLLSDINKLEGGIEQKFNRPRIQPRNIVPLKGDYLTVIGKGE